MKSGQTVRISRASKFYPGHTSQVSAIFQNGFVSVLPIGAPRYSSLQIHESQLEALGETAAVVDQAASHGRQAFALGFAESDNPHTAGTPTARAWESAWRLAAEGS